MKKYISFFRLRFAMNLQYRVAALAGIVCQFAWGGMAILAFYAFYETDPASFPMDFQATASYIWMQQAFLGLLSVGAMDNSIFNTIQTGDVVYEVCRPVDLYAMWFSHSAATRIAKALLRCVPPLIIAAFLPKPFGLMAPPSLMAFLLFLVALCLALLVTTSFCMVVYILTFYTISYRGVRMVAVSLSDFLMGGIVPLPFFPEGFRQFAELLPFSCMENVPLRVYSGDLDGPEMARAILLQIFWVFALVLIGKVLEQKALKRVVVQGG